MTATVTSPPTKSTNILFVLLCLIVVSSASLAAEDATILVSYDLKKEPFIDAESLVNIPKDTKVKVLKQKGAWYQISVPDKNNISGWVRLTSLRLRPAPAPDLSGIRPGPGPATSESNQEQKKDDPYEDEYTGGTSLQKALSGASFGRGGVTESSTTTGIRGLGKEDIANAQPNTRALEDLDAMTADKGDSSDFVNVRQLVPKQIDYLVKLDGIKAEKKPPAEAEEE
ncbi:MAG: hypothetical protein BMS9Abin26_2147 [Gammaproteobacteria bacterium]|nr:MAG: hypothetical protein BMS9Abin26_2147 [Gammaproteobacteria bacterium]